MALDGATAAALLATAAAEADSAQPAALLDLLSCVRCREHIITYREGLPEWHPCVLSEQGHARLIPGHSRLTAGAMPAGCALLCWWPRLPLPPSKCLQPLPILAATASAGRLTRGSSVQRCGWRRVPAGAPSKMPQVSIPLDMYVVLTTCMQDA